MPPVWSDAPPPPTVGGWVRRIGRATVVVSIHAPARARLRKTDLADPARQHACRGADLPHLDCRGMDSRHVSPVRPPEMEQKATAGCSFSLVDHLPWDLRIHRAPLPERCCNLLVYSRRWA